MRILPVVGLLGASVTALVIACGDDATTTFSWNLAVVVEGDGSVASDPAGLVTCDGPKDCGTVTLTAKDVTLRATPKPGNAVVSVTLDTAAPDTNPTLALHATTSGEKHSVVVKFAPGGPGGSPPGTPGSTPPGANDAGNDAEAGGPTGLVCGSAGACGADQCCISGSPFEFGQSDAGPTCGASCAQGRVTTCLADTDCTGGDVCCFRGEGGPSTISCTSESTCQSEGGFRVCSAAFSCTGGKACQTINSNVTTQFCAPQIAID